jgi:hypothetical protein
MNCRSGKRESGEVFLIVGSSQQLEFVGDATGGDHVTERRRDLWREDVSGPGALPNADELHRERFDGLPNPGRIGCDFQGRNGPPRDLAMQLRVCTSTLFEVCERPLFELAD